MRKPKRVVGLQAAGGAAAVVAETGVGTRVSGASTRVVMPESCKRHLGWGWYGYWTILMWGV
jgi:hypothetical protein